MIKVGEYVYFTIGGKHQINKITAYDEKSGTVTFRGLHWYERLYFWARGCDSWLWKLLARIDNSKCYNRFLRVIPFGEWTILVVFVVVVALMAWNWDEWF